MVIRIERFEDTTAIHDHKRGAVREGPCLVVTGTVQFDSFLKNLGVGTNDFEAMVLPQCAHDSTEQMPVPNVAQMIGQLQQDPLTRDDLAVHAVGRTGSGVKIPVIRVQQGEEEERICKAGSHDDRSLRCRNSALPPDDPRPIPTIMPA